MTIPHTPEFVEISVEATSIRWAWKAVRDDRLLDSQSGRFDRPQPQLMARRFALLKSQKFNLDHPGVKTHTHIFDGGVQ